MSRTCLACAFVCFLAVALRAEDSTALKDALALEKTMQEAIQQAEPAVACIIVSRSDAYLKFFQDQPPADRPGQLGAFDPPVAIRRSRPFPRGDDSQREDAIRKKCDLADPDNVPEDYGSGVVIDGDELLILTNYHVVRDATKIYIRLPG